MRRISTLVVAALYAAALSPAVFGQAAKPAPAPRTVTSPRTPSYKNLKYPALNQVNVPSPARFELSNGMVVYLVEDHELPKITVSAIIRAGSRWEPVGKAGLAEITATVMRTGGTATQKGDQLDEELDRLGARVESGISEASGRAAVSVLKEDIGRGLSILADILEHPAFPQDKIDLAKTMHREEIARRNDEPSAIARRELLRLLYGKDGPYGHQTEYDTINAITRDDLVSFHKQFYQPENVILGAWGDFKTEEMRAAIEKSLGAWARGGQPKPPAPEVDASAVLPGLYAVEKEDVNQSNVSLGLIGGKRNDPDYYALVVMSDILGGGFSSRLFKSVRSEEGLAYSVAATWDGGWDHRGTFRVGGGTKSASTVKMLESIKREIEKIRTAEVTPDELQTAKDGILKGLAFDFDSTGKVVERLMTYEYFGYPKDYLQRYRENIDKVTRADVLRVAKQYLDTGKLAIVVLGKQKDFDRPLSSLGPITPIDITIPKPRQEALAATTPEATARGRELLAGARKAMGGAALDAVNEYTTIANFAITTPQGEMAMKTESTSNFSGKLLGKMGTPMGEIVQGFDGEVFWLRTPQGTREMPASAKDEAAGSLFRDTIALLKNAGNSAYTVQALGPAELDGKKVEAVAVSDPARKLQVKLWIDPATGLLLKKAYTASMMGAPGQLEEMYSDYRETAGLKLPYKVLMNRDGKKFGEQTVTEFRINPGLDEAAYKKPN